MPCIRVMMEEREMEGGWGTKKEPEVWEG